MNPANAPFGGSSFRVGLKWPTTFTLLSLIFLYVLQYPLSRVFFEATEVVEYELVDWVVAYAFVAYSSVILLVFMRLGISGPRVMVPPPPQFIAFRMKRIPFLAVGLIVLLFFMWSYLMRNLKIGMTIYTDFDPLPFRLVGILFYGRLIVQPLILAYIAREYADLRWKKFGIFLLFAGLGAWAALTSGSRFTGIMFALPHLLLFKGKSRYIIFALLASAFITIATLARHFYLPFYISDEYIEIYANLEYQENILSGVSTLAVGYFVSRTMGISEVLLTLGFGSITSTFVDALLAALAFFFAIPIQFDAASMKNVYGLDDAFGGFGLGLFPNYWVLLGGNPITYTFGLVISAYLLGKCYRLLSIGLARFGFADGVALLFVILFVFFFEARAYIFPGLIIFGWLISRPKAPKLFYSLLPRWQRNRARYLADSDDIREVRV